MKNVYTFAPDKIETRQVNLICVRTIVPDRRVDDSGESISELTSEVSRSVSPNRYSIGMR
jgi:hypothetical protein